MEKDALKTKFELKELELNSLLEITQAINNNLPEESLYKIYNFTLRANLNIKKLALYVLDEKWECKVNFGTKKDFLKIKLDQRFLSSRNIGRIDQTDQQDPFSEFEKVFPVTHKEKILAFVFAGGEDENSVDAATGHTTLIQTLSNIIIVAIENKKLARRQLQQEALKKEIEIAKNVQQFLFPKNLPYDGRLKIAADYIPHREVGGDYYDFIPINEDEFLFCIADVSGKGIPAALLMSNFQASLHTLIRKTSDLKEVIEELNYQIMKNVNRENFITSFVAIYNQAKKKFRYVNSGHHPPFLFYDGKETLLENGSTILGNFDPLPFLDPEEISDVDSFYFFGFTDGLTELFNEDDEQYGEKRLAAFITKNKHLDPRELHRLLIEEINAYKGAREYHDDITLLSCRLNP